jgi:hypothetical protein
MSASGSTNFNRRWPGCLVGIDDLVTRLQAARSAATPATVASLDSYWTFLKQSTLKMDQLLHGKRPPDSQPGDYEFGPILPVLQYELPNDSVTRLLVELLRSLKMPQSPIDQVRWNEDLTILDASGVVASDGSLVVHSDLAVADYCWVIAFIKYLLLEAEYDTLHGFVKASGPITVSGRDSLTLALAGDWGSGPWDDPGETYPAKAVLEGMQATSPDYMIHLGDVYYAGTSSASYIDSDEEKRYFTDLWKAGSLGALALNSNHEMYSGANGLYEALGNPLFAAQGGATYFAIEFMDWLILGLDTAYYDTSTLFMTGALTDSDQLGFVRALNPKGKHVLLLTHHTGLAYDGSALNQPLWGQVCSALGKQPEVWYWGHVHNGIVYSSKSPAGKTLARCCGHGALPFGAAYGLQTPGGGTVPTVTYYAHTPLGGKAPPQKLRVLNGFATVCLEKGKIIERFYEQGNPNAVWELATTF